MLIFRLLLLIESKVGSDDATLLLGTRGTVPRSKVASSGQTFIFILLKHYYITALYFDVATLKSVGYSVVYNSVVHKLTSLCFLPRSGYKEK